MPRKTQQLTFLIGLYSSGDPTSWVAGPRRWLRSRVRRRRALKILAREYPAFTAFAARGLWDGQAEPSLSVVVLVDEPSAGVLARARSIARQLAEELDQDLVAVTSQIVALSLDRPDSAARPGG